MAKRLVVYPYKMKSEAGKLLSTALDALRVYADRDYVPKTGDLIVNWGNGHTPLWAAHAQARAMILNHWDNVDQSICKLTAFAGFKKKGVRTPDWTKDKDKAADWIREGSWVCCREVTEGMDGQGLNLAKTIGKLSNCNLYTRYIPIKKEYRTYVFREKVIDILEKRRDSDALAKGTVNPDIRTEANNWVFCRQNIHVTHEADLHKQSVNAIAALGLDFGGVDVIESSEDGKYYVLETNTAPGIAGTTVSRFADEIQEVFKEM